MYHIPTQTDFSIIKQHTKDIYVKVNLLNSNYKILDSFDGSLISDNISVDSQGEQRRSYTCELHVSDPSFLIGRDKKIWIDKYIQVFYGIRSLRTNEIVYWLIGTFSYQTVDYAYNATTNNLSLKCVDRMADYDGTKNGQMVIYDEEADEYKAVYELKIDAGEKIRDVVIGLLKNAGIERYYVEDIGKEIPYDLEFNGTFTYCDVWIKIRDLYDSWEFFFDVDGTFIWQKIPTGLSDQIILDDTTINPIWISEDTSYNFSGIYNKTEVWGKVLELEYEDRYTEECSFSIENGVGVYTINLPSEGNVTSAEKIENGEVLNYVNSISEIEHLDQIGIRITADSIGGDKVRIGESTIPIVNDDGTPIIAGRMKAGEVYVFSYRRNLGEMMQNCLYLLGQYQCYGSYTETNPECPFSLENLGYLIVNKVNYDDLYSDDLCYNQAEYLTYQTTALLDTINLNLQIIPWIDVNNKIIYTSKQTGETAQYMVKSFSWSSLSGTMSMTLYRFRESFSYVKNR